ncbi:TetR/AcrR family transcriptional regulator [Sorangium sp. So ce1182]|uniref:TetR/AcrR family transcriptional regulator n=1 Tax=unclassified Sorangium TaxID=2621164 RepID=UPI003F5E481A
MIVYQMADEAKKETRRALLDAAAEEFARHGPQGARVQAIVGRAGVNERMIYHHFGSKDGLYRAVLEEQWSGLMAAWRPTLEESATLEPREGLWRSFTAFFRLLLANPRIMPLALHEAMSGWRSAPPATLARLPSQLRDLYERGQRGGVFRSDCDFELLYCTVLGALTAIGIFGPRFLDVRERLERDPELAARLGEQTVSLVLDGVTAPGGGGRVDTGKTA